MDNMEVTRNFLRNCILQILPNRVEDLNFDENLFKIGLDSLQITTMELKIMEEYRHFSIPLGFCYKHFTLNKITRALMEHQKQFEIKQLQTHSESSNNKTKKTDANRNFSGLSIFRHLVLSHAQRRCFFSSRLYPTLNLTERVLICLSNYCNDRHSKVNIQLVNALNSTIMPNTILRSGILPDGNGQIIYSGTESFFFFSHELCGSIHDSENVITLNNSKIPLRFGYISNDKDKKTLFAIFHNIIADGRSMCLFIKQFLSSLNIFKIKNAKVSILQYYEFVFLEEKILSGKKFSVIREKCLKYWLGKLSRIEESYRFEKRHFSLPSINEVEAIKFSTGRIEIILGDDRHDYVASHLFSLARLCNATPFAVLVSIFRILLSKMFDAKDVPFGTPIDNRNAFREIMDNHTNDFSHSIGPYLNFCILRTPLHSKIQLIEFIKQNSIEIQTALCNSQLPFDEVLARFRQNSQQNFKEEDLFQIVVIQDVFISDEDLSEYELETFQPVKSIQLLSYNESNNEFLLRSQYPMMCHFIIEKNRIKLLIDYANEFFSDCMVGTLSKLYSTICKSICDSLNKNELEELILENISMLTENDLIEHKQRIENQLNAKNIINIYKFSSISINSNHLACQSNCSNIYQKKKFLKEFPSPIYLLFSALNYCPSNKILVEDGYGNKLNAQELLNNSIVLSKFIEQAFFQVNGVTLKPDHIVCVLHKRNTQLITLISAIWLAGAAVLPISTDWPSSKINKAIKEFDKEILFITDKKEKVAQKICSKYVLAAHLFRKMEYRLKKLFKKNSKFPKLTTIGSSYPKISSTKTIYGTFEVGNSLSTNKILKDEKYKLINYKILCKNHNMSNLLYLTFSSGSTGKPKIIATEGIGLSQLIFNYTTIFNYDYNSVVYQVVNYAFDIFFADVFTALTNGAKLILARDAIPQLDELKKCTHAYIMPAYLSRFDDEKYLRLLAKLKVVQFGGESISQEWLSLAINANVKLVQLFGLTEASIYSTYQWFTRKRIMQQILFFNSSKEFKKIANLKSFLKHQSMKIGTPFPGVYIFAIDSEHNLLPVDAIGSEGRLCIGGHTVARGYIKNTGDNKLFQFNPLLQIRFFQTCDRVLIDTDKSFKFLGRMDQFIKIRGHLIELVQLQMIYGQLIPSTRQCIVEFWKDELIAFFTLKQQNTTNQNIKNSLINELQKKYPPHLIPNQVFVVPEFKLNSNGKIDRKILHSLITIENNNSCDNVESQSERIRSQIHNDVFSEQICKIFAKNLNIKGLGFFESVFERGADSFRIMMACQEVEKSLHLNISVEDVFKYKTVEKMVEKAVHNHSNLHFNEKIEARFQSMPLNFNKCLLSYNQEHMWLLEKISKNYSYYICLKLHFNKKPNLYRIHYAINRLIQENAVLRSVIFSSEYNDEMPYQRILSATESYINFEIGEYFDESTSTFNVDDEIPIKVKIMKTKEFTLQITLHHIAVDWASLINISYFLPLFYNSNNNRKTHVNYEIQDPYAYINFARLQRSQNFSKDLEFWNEELKDVKNNLILTDYSTSNRENDLLKKTIDIVDFELDVNNDQLDEYNLRNSCTPYQLFLSAYLLANFYSKRNSKFNLGVAFANRNPEVRRVIGYFATVHALNFSLQKETNIAEFFSYIKDRLLNASKHAAIPFELVVRRLKPKRIFGRNPIFQVTFAYENDELDKQFDTNIDNEIMKNPNFIDKTNLIKFSDSLYANVKEERTMDPKFDQCWRILNKCQITNLQQKIKKFRCAIEYNTALFKRSSIEAIGEIFNKALLFLLNSDPETNISMFQLKVKDEHKVQEIELKLIKHDLDQIKILEKSEIVEKLKNIWNRLLKIDNNIGIDENFFELGGHSLLANRVCAEIRREMQLDCDMATLFKNQSIRELSEVLWKHKQCSINSNRCAENSKDSSNIRSVSTSLKDEINRLEVIDKRNKIYEDEETKNIIPFLNRFLSKNDNNINIDIKIPACRLQNALLQLYLNSNSAHWRATSANIESDLVYAYTIRIEIRFIKNINKLRLYKSFCKFIERHVAWRTFFEYDDNNSEEINFYQRVLPTDHRIFLEYVFEGEWNNGKRFYQTMKEETCRNNLQLFNPFYAPPLKILLNENLLRVDVSHLIFDGSSINIFAQELFCLYNSDDNDNLDKCPSSNSLTNYLKFSAEFNAKVEEKQAQIHKFWKNIFANFKEANYIINDCLNDVSCKPSPNLNRISGIKEYSFKNLNNKLKTVCKCLKVSPLSVCIFALSKIIQQKMASFNSNFFIGTPVDMRTQLILEQKHDYAMEEELMNEIGFFVNTLPIPFNVNKFGNTMELLQQLCSMNDLINKIVAENSFITYDGLLKLAETDSLFDVMLVLEINKSKSETIFKKDETIISGDKQQVYNAKFISENDFEVLETKTLTTKFDITVFVTIDGEKIDLRIEFIKSRYDEAFIDALANCWAYILEQIAQCALEPKNKLKNLIQLFPPESFYYAQHKDTESNESNNIKNNDIIQIFIEQARLTPDAIAIQTPIFKNYITYRELLTILKHLAHYIRRRVFECLDVTNLHDYVISILGKRNCAISIILSLSIMYAGAAYLPIDINITPLSRIKAIFKESNINFAIMAFVSSDFEIRKIEFEEKIKIETPEKYLEKISKILVKFLLKENRELFDRKKLTLDEHLKAYESRLIAKSCANSEMWPCPADVSTPCNTPKFDNANPFFQNDTNFTNAITNVCGLSTSNTSLSKKSSTISAQTNTFINFNSIKNKKENVKRGEDLAYVIFTSGTTGVPKGVAIERRGIVNMVAAATRNFCVDNDSCIYQFTNFCFDNSVLEIFVALCNGARLFVDDNEFAILIKECKSTINKEIKKVSFMDEYHTQLNEEPTHNLRIVIGSDFENEVKNEIKNCDADKNECMLAKSTDENKFFCVKRFLKHVEEFDITHAFLYPALVETFETAELIILARLRFWISGAERLSSRLMQAASKHGVRIAQCYGPTETTCFALSRRMHDDDNAQNLGRPIENMFLTVRTPNGDVALPNTTHALYVGGMGLMRGYVNRKRHEQPFYIFDNIKYYCTGDFVKRLPNGEICFVGREDSQLKLRGFRVELSDIERTLNSAPEVIIAKVLSISNSDGCVADLVAYVACKNYNEKSFKQEEKRLRLFCQQQLPYYMIPRFFIMLKKMPLTPNAKIDVEKLKIYSTNLGGITAENLDEVNINSTNNNLVESMDEEKYGENLLSLSSTTSNDSKIMINQFKLKDNLKLGIANLNNIRKKVINLIGDILNLPDIEKFSDCTFIYLGGNSLNGQRVINRLCADMKIDSNESSLSELLNFETTINNFTDHIISIMQLHIESHQSTNKMIDKLVDRKNKTSKQLNFQKNSLQMDLTSFQIPLSHQQAQMWYLSNVDVHRLYTLPLIQKFKRTVDLYRLHAAFMRVVQRHATLRTVLYEQSCNNYDIYQEVLSATESFNTFVNDGQPLLHYKFDDKQFPQFNQENVYNFCKNKFNLLTEMPFKCQIFNADEFLVVIILIHHIACDAASTRIIENDLIREYNSSRITIMGDHFPNQYSIWSISQQSNEMNEYYKKKAKRFSEKIGKVLERKFDVVKFFRHIINLESLNYENSKFNYENSKFKYEMNQSGMFSMRFKFNKTMVQSSLLTAYDFFGLALWRTIFNMTTRYGKIFDDLNEEFFVIGGPASNRQEIAIESTVGNFLTNIVTVLPIKLKNMPLCDMITTMREETNSTYKFSDIPFGIVLDSLRKNTMLNIKAGEQIYDCFYNCRYELEDEMFLHNHEEVIVEHEFTENIIDNWIHNNQRILDHFMELNIDQIDSEFHIAINLQSSILFNFKNDDKECIGRYINGLIQFGVEFLNECNCIYYLTVKNIVNTIKIAIFEMLPIAKDFDKSISFFALGGNSLLLLKLRRKLEHAFSIQIDIFELIESANASIDRIIILCEKEIMKHISPKESDFVIDNNKIYNKNDEKSELNADSIYKQNEKLRNNPIDICKNINCQNKNTKVLNILTTKDDSVSNEQDFLSLDTSTFKVNKDDMIESSLENNYRIKSLETFKDEEQKMHNDTRNVDLSEIYVGKKFSPTNIHINNAVETIQKAGVIQKLLNISTIETIHNVNLIVFFHALIGGNLSYTMLCNALDKQWRSSEACSNQHLHVIGVQHPETFQANVNFKYDTLTKLVQFYSNCIKDFIYNNYDNSDDKLTKITFIGASLGAVIAYECASNFNDKRITTIISIDGSAEMPNYYNLSKQEHATQMLNIIRHRENAIEGPDEIKKGINDSNSIDEEIYSQMIKNSWQLLQLRFAHQHFTTINNMQIRFVLLKAIDVEYSHRNDYDDYGWSKVGGEMTVHIDYIDGDHTTMLDADKCDSLARKIITYLC